MKTDPNTVECDTCEAKPGEPCRIGSGAVRATPHTGRRFRAHRAATSTGRENRPTMIAEPNRPTEELRP